MIKKLWYIYLLKQNGKVDYLSVCFSFADVFGLSGVNVECQHRESWVPGRDKSLVGWTTNCHL